MDFLLSVPILSYFLGPGLASSWSTSFNLLFFYVTWSTLVLSHPPFRIHLAGVLALRVALWLVPSLLFLAFDCLVPSLAQSIKLGGASSLPPRRPLVLARLLTVAVVNLVLLVAAEGLSVWGVDYLFRTPVFQTSTTLPLPWQMMKHLSAMLAARELLTYLVHRYLLHPSTSSSLSHISTLHARHAHARSAPPFSLSLFTDHPLPLLFHRLVPALLPALALRPHLLTYFVFVALVTLEETFAMSGYAIVPGIIMGGIARRTAVHYASAGRGNFGAWGLLDWWSDTSHGGDVLEDVRAEAEKHRVKERGEGAVKGGMGFLERGWNEAQKGRRGRKAK